MAYEFDTSESADAGGAWLDKDGVYHFMVLAVDEQPASKKGDAINGFSVSFSVLGKDQFGKTWDSIFFNPDKESKDQGNFARKKITRFLLATGLLSEFKPSTKVRVNLQSAVGRQVVAAVEHGIDRDGKPTKFLQLRFADIFHVDDSDRPQCEMNSQALALIPANLRKAAAAPSSQAAVNPAAKSAVSVDDL